LLLEDGCSEIKFPRVNDHAWPGDWQADEVRLPDELAAARREAVNTRTAFSASGCNRKW